jgi:CRP-like cAMP-binding protein
MSDNGLGRIPMFAAMTPEELAAIEAAAVEETFAPGDLIYEYDDPSGGMYVVVDGAVETFAVFEDDVEKTLMTARTGMVFGWIALVSRQSRTASARALDPTHTLRFDREPLETLERENPSAYAKMLEFFMRTMSQQVRAGLEQLKATIAWSLEISALSQLNLASLIQDKIGVVVELINGNQINGRILKFEPSSAGQEILLVDPEGALHLIPYHAVVRIALARGVVPEADETRDLTREL